MKLDIGLVALDLDDTLLRCDLTISDRTVQTIAKVEDRGIPVILASGRAPEAMTPYAKRIGLDTRDSFLITNNGSQVIRSNTGETVFEHFLPPDLAVEAFRLVLDAGLSCHTYEGNIMYVSKETEYSNQDNHLSGLQTVVPDDYEALLRKGVYKLVIPGHPEFIVPVEQIFKEHFEGRVTIFVSKPYFMEILPIEAGKGEALSEVAALLGVEQNRVMAFGDSMNDESMIRWAGQSVAMSNGRQEILALAKHKTYHSNNDDGIADFLEKHVL